jgi:hypothetical protein
MFLEGLLNVGGHGDNDSIYLDCVRIERSVARLLLGYRGTSDFSSRGRVNTTPLPDSHEVFPIGQSDRSGAFRHLIN